MTPIEDLKKAGVVGMFILPPPSWKLRLIVTDGANEIIQDASIREYDKFRLYFDQIESRQIPIPEEFRIKVSIREPDTKEESVNKDSIEFTELEKILLNDLLSPEYYPTPQDVWNGIQELSYNLTGRFLALYLKQCYLFVRNIRTDVCNDESLLKEVGDRLSREGVSLFLNASEKSDANKDQIDTIRKELNQIKLFIKKRNKKQETDNIHLSKTLNDIFAHQKISIDGIHTFANDRFKKLDDIYDILDRVADIGIPFLEAISEMTKARMVAMHYLRDNHGNIKIKSINLHKLPKHIQLEVKDYLNTHYGNSPDAHSIMTNLFRPPRKRNRKSEY